MKNIIIRLFAASFLFAFAAAPVMSQNREEIIFKALADEMKSEMDGLRLPGYSSPFMMTYGVTDVEYFSASASLGALNSSTYIPLSRSSIIGILCGDYGFTSNKDYKPGFSEGRMASDDNYDQIRRDLWAASDKVFKNATMTYMSKQQTAKRMLEKSDLPELQEVEPVVALSGNTSAMELDKAEWEDKLRDISASLKKYNQLTNTNVMFSAIGSMRYVINSEGTKFKQPVRMYILSAVASAVTDEGKPLSDYITIVVDDIRDMPSAEKIKSQLAAMSEELISRVKSPIVEEHYFGPVMFEGRAVINILSNIFLNENCLYSYRKPIDAQGGSNTMDSRLGKRIVDTRMTITNYSDLKEYDGRKTIGSYEIDLEGVIPPKQCVLVENGILKQTIGSRVPSNTQPASTGSMRFGAGAGAVAPGVLHVSVAKGKKDDALKKALIKGAVEEDNDYAYIVRSVGEECKLYRVDVKSGKETLVRHGDVSKNINLAKLRRLLDVSAKEQVHNYAVNNSILSTLICPNAIILEDIEITPKQIKKEKVYYTTSPLDR